MPKGFYKVRVYAPSMEYPVLPFRSPSGKLTFPSGEWTGIYYSDELLLAKEYGYEFEAIEALAFTDNKPFLRDYVNEFTKIKERGGAYRAIAKLFINSLYGRFGFKRTEQETVVISADEERYFINRFEIIDRVDLGSDMLLLSYNGKPVYDYYQESGIESLYRKELKAYKQRYSYSESNVGVAAAITALGRIRLYKDMMSVIENGGKIAYCDTDSIFAEFDESPMGQTHGNVYWDPIDPNTNFEEGVFLAAKMYSIKDRHSHVKGVKQDSVRHESLLTALIRKDASLTVEARQFVKRDYNIHLRSLTKEYDLWDDEKREWYNDGERWLTKPLIINMKEEMGDSPLDANVVAYMGPEESKRLDFSKANIPIVKPNEPQLLDGDVEISYGDKDEIIVSLLPASKRWGLIYYVIMAKLSLPVKPKFIKILLYTEPDRDEALVYTVGPYIYNPEVRFDYTLPSFIKWITHEISIVKERYDIKAPCLVDFVLQYDSTAIHAVNRYKVVYPIPDDFHREALRSELAAKKLRKQKLELAIKALEDEIKASEQEIKGVTDHDPDIPED